MPSAGEVDSSPSITELRFVIEVIGDCGKTLPRAKARPTVVDEKTGTDEAEDTDVDELAGGGIA